MKLRLSDDARQGVEPVQYERVIAQNISMKVCSLAWQQNKKTELVEPALVSRSVEIKYIGTSVPTIRA